MKDDSGSYEVFTEQGSSASQKRAAQVIGFYIKTTRMRRTRSRRGSKWKMHQRYWKFQGQNVQTFGFVYQNTNGQNHGLVWKIQSFLLSEICTVILQQDYYGKVRQFENFFWKTVGKDSLNWRCLLFDREKDFSCLCMLDDIKLAEKKKNMDPMWKRHRYGETDIILWPR